MAEQNTKESPRLSVVICTYNRHDYLITALRSLANQSSNPAGFEIIVVDNNSTDDTEKITADFMQANKAVNIRYVKEPGQGLSYARNKGIESASSPLVSFIDDDAIADYDYVKNLISAFENYPLHAAVGGKVIPIYPDNIEPVWMSRHLWGLVAKVDYGDTHADFYNRKYPVGCNMAFRKEVFLETGLFNTDLANRNDDKYIFGLLRQHSKRILYAPDVSVRHQISPDRLTPDFIKKLSLLIGKEEKIRMKGQSLVNRLIKTGEFLLKITAACFLGIIFILKGRPARLKIISVRWHILQGFLKYKY